METVVELETGRFLRFTSISAREVIIRHHPLSTVKENYDTDGNIISLIIDGFEIKQNVPFSVKLFTKKEQLFKPIYIQKSKREATYALFSTKLTKASTWILPMLRLTNETRTSMKFNSYFVNCYIGTSDVGYMEEICLVYRFSGDTEYKLFEDSLINHELFSRTVDLDHHHTMYIFNIPVEFKKDFYKFIEGRYSEFSQPYKNKILNFVVNPAITNREDLEKTLWYGVLYKTDKRKKDLLDQIGSVTVAIDDLEYFSIPEESNEVYNGDIEIEKASTIEAARDIQK